MHTQPQAQARVLPPREAAVLRARFDTLVLDCDGVVWRGGELVEGVAEALATLRREGKRLLFVTNNSSKSRRQCAAKFAGFGIDVDEAEVVTSSFAAAAYLLSSSSSSSLSRGGVLLLGERGLEEELSLAGIPFVGGVQQQQQQQQRWPTTLTTEAFPSLLADAAVPADLSAVVVGFDGEFSYYKLCLASASLQAFPVAPCGEAHRAARLAADLAAGGCARRRRSWSPRTWTPATSWVGCSCRAPGGW